MFLRSSTEANIAGLNIIQDTEESGEYIKITEFLIPARGDSITGAIYRYIDILEQSDDYFY
ncbi:hypothetical protein JW935_14560 [candidate division KSB1 bacterium]|nr:hypothetical protein [candidate division KSB1 bacterium]